MPRLKPTPSPDPAAVRIRLRELAEADGRRLAEIAEGAGMAPSQLSNTLTGQKVNPSVGTVARILAALGRRWKDLD